MKTMRKTTGKPRIFILFFTDVKRFHFEGRSGHWSFLPLIFVNNSAEIKFRIQQKTSVYFYNRKQYKNCYICLKEGQTLELRLNDTECTLSPSLKIYSLHLHQAQLEDLDIVSYLNFGKVLNAQNYATNIEVFLAFE